MRTSFARTLVLLASVGLVVGLPVVGCRGKPGVAFELTLPSDVVPSTVWFEIGAFPGSSCAAVTPMLPALRKKALREIAIRRLLFR